MVFSFFKKKQEKMPEREVMRPKAPTAPVPVKPALPEEDEQKRPEPLPDLEFTSAGQPASAPAAAAGNPAESKSKADLEQTMSEFEREYTESNVMAIDVDHGADSIQFDIE